MPNPKFSRRTFLRSSAVGSCIFLPLPIFEYMLNSHGTAYANGDDFPRRFCVWWYGNGVKPNQWFPTETGPNYALTPHLQPMAAVKDDITVVTGSRCPVRYHVHFPGQAGMLTGAEWAGRDGCDCGDFTSKSVDVLVSEQWEDSNLVNLAVHQTPETGNGVPGQISHNGNSFNPNIWDPGEVYDRLFAAGVPMPEPQAGEEADDDEAQALAEARAAARVAAFDATQDAFLALNQKLGRADQLRLKQHREALWTLRERVERFERDAGGGAGGEGCMPPGRPGFSQPQNDGANIREKSQLMNQLVAQAFACGQSRVVSYQHHTWYAPVFSEARGVDGGTVVTGAQHGLTHDEGGDQPQVQATVHFVMENFAHLIQSLKELNEGTGTVLDNSLVYSTSDCREGRAHDLDDMPVLLAGGAGGGLVQGTHVRLDGTSSSRVVMSMFRALGLDIASFGTGDITETEPVSELLV